MTEKALLHPSWLALLEEEFKLPYMKQLEAFLRDEYTSNTPIYPPFPQIFNALCRTPFDQVKVVLVGQDPYHNPGQAHGLSFSVVKGVPPPPSLQNIFKELQADLGCKPPGHGCLESWADQGVLLLNATLTVRENQPKSHWGKGWERFTDRIVELVWERDAPVVFLLWGRSAMEKLAKFQNRKNDHLVLTAPHPSPFSAHSGFFGSRPFSKINQFLKERGIAEIEWQLV